MSASKWRAHAAPIIARVLRETSGQSADARRKALHDAYPFGPRQHHPYKIWLDEIKRQTGRKDTSPEAERTRAAARQAFIAAGRPVPAWCAEDGE